MILVRVHILLSTLNTMKGLGMWTRSVVQGTTNRRARLKARKKSSKKSSKGKSLFSNKEQTSGSGESAAVHFAQSSLLSLGDKSEKSDNDPAVVKTVETLTVAGCDALALKQEKEARSSGGIPSR
jgi:hypothetical protein